MDSELRFLTGSLGLIGETDKAKVYHVVAVKGENTKVPHTGRMTKEKRLVDMETYGDLFAKVFP